MGFVNLEAMNSINGKSCNEEIEVGWFLTKHFDRKSSNSICIEMIVILALAMQECLNLKVVDQNSQRPYKEELEEKRKFLYRNFSSSNVDFMCWET